MTFSVAKTLTFAIEIFRCKTKQGQLQIQNNGENWNNWMIKDKNPSYEQTESFTWRCGLRRTRLVDQFNEIFQLRFQVFYCSVDVWILNQIANHGASAGKRRLVRIGRNESIIQENFENDHNEKPIRRLHSEISNMPEVVKWSLWTSFEAICSFYDTTSSAERENFLELLGDSVTHNESSLHSRKPFGTVNQNSSIQLANSAWLSGFFKAQIHFSSVSVYSICPIYRYFYVKVQYKSIEREQEKRLHKWFEKVNMRSDRIS